MTKFFNDALKLTKMTPMPDDIIEQLDAYYELVTEDEKSDFLWLYEAAELETNLLEK